jgi:tetratricopeptide (TPR) repeat protein
MIDTTFESSSLWRPEHRSLRVFVSSTFCDMKEERERLAKYVFPQLRRFCENRSVGWGEVDLRWGITEESKAEGKVLPICLEEIRRCQIFIGLLGERYGWVPEVSPDGVYGSVTEREIVEGALDSPARAERAFFYFRDPAYVTTLPRRLRSEFIEENPESARKLAELKDRIRCNSPHVRENYRDARALGDLVLRDITALVDRLYPEKKVTDALARMAAEHEAFVRSRTMVYVARPTDHERLDRHLAGDGPPLVVTGPSGSGKSTLLANWEQRLRASCHPPFIFSHYIGVTSQGGDWVAMLHRLLEELRRRFDIRLPLPESPDALRHELPVWLRSAAEAGRSVLVIDALNELEGFEGSANLDWLPREIPNAIRLIVSSTPGPSLDALQEREWPCLRIAPLAYEERRDLIVKFLRHYSKELDNNRIALISEAKLAENPLFLTVVMEELRLIGSQEELNDRINQYLRVDNPATLFAQLLDRYEEDYESDRPGLVRDAMTAIWASRGGLAEYELLACVGSRGERNHERSWLKRLVRPARSTPSLTSPLPQAYWSPLFLASGASMANGSGFIRLAHPYIKEAVRARYLPAVGDERSAHLRVASYFESLDVGPRKVRELPWQLRQASEWTKLQDVLFAPPFFKEAWRRDEFEVRRYCLEMRTIARLDVGRACARAMHDSGGDFGLGFQLAELLMHMGDAAAACAMFHFLVDCFRTRGDLANAQACVGNEGICLHRLGRHEDAMEKFREQEALAREIGHEEGLTNALIGEALILREKGQEPEADAALSRVVVPSEVPLAGRAGLGALLGRAVLLADEGRKAEALVQFQRLARECRVRGFDDLLLTCLGNAALIHREQGELAAAAVCAREQEKLARSLDNLQEELRALDIQADIAVAREQWDQAVTLFERQEPLCAQVSNTGQLMRCLVMRAGILAQHLHRHDLALPLSERAFELANEQNPEKAEAMAMADRDLIGDGASCGRTRIGGANEPWSYGGGVRDR